MACRCPAAVEPVLVRETRRGRNGTDAAELRERRFGVNSFGVVAKDDEHLGGDVGANAERFAQRRCSFLGQSIEQAIVLDDLFTEHDPAPASDRRVYLVEACTVLMSPGR